MRTCAAHIEAKAQDDVAMPPEVSRDAVNLLREAAYELEKGCVAEAVSATELDLELSFPPPSPDFAIDHSPQAHWIGDDLKPIPNQPAGKNACPNCDSRTTKTVRMVNKRMELECPVCGHRWRR